VTPPIVYLNRLGWNILIEDCFSDCGVNVENIKYIILWLQGQHTHWHLLIQMQQ